MVYGAHPGLLAPWATLLLEYVKQQELELRATVNNVGKLQTRTTSDSHLHFGMEKTLAVGSENGTSGWVGRSNQKM